MNVVRSVPKILIILVHILNTGTVKRGTVKKGDSGEVMGFGFRSKTSISGLQVFNKNVQAVGAGENVGINIKSVKADQLEKGMVLAAPNSLRPTNHFEVKISTFISSPFFVENCFYSSLFSTFECLDERSFETYVW